MNNDNIYEHYYYSSQINLFYYTSLRRIYIILLSSGSCSQIERVQSTFLKYASFVLHIDCLPHDYTPVLVKLNLEMLIVGRKKANLAFLSKLLSGEVSRFDRED